MIWDVLSYTLNTLLYWEIYAAGSIFLIFAFGPMLILSLFHEGIGALFGMIIQPFFHALGMMVFITLIMPIALGFGDQAAWHLPWQFISDVPWQVGKSALLIIVASIAIAFIPVLGQLQTFSVLALGVIAIKLVFELAGVNGISFSDLLPDLWVSIGILLLGALASLCGMFAATLLSVVVSSIFRMDSDAFTPLLLLPIASTLNFAPLLIYMSWLRASLT